MAARASAWLQRLQATRAFDRDGREHVSLAQIAFRAGQDTLARTILDTRLSTLGMKTEERSFTLAFAVALFADSTQDTARLVRNFPVALSYTQRLLALPSAGYRTRSDSTNVRERQIHAMTTLLSAALASRRPEFFLAQLREFLVQAARPRFRHGSQSDLVRQFPYIDIAMALMTVPSGQAMIDTLNTRLAALGYTQLSQDRVALSFIGTPAPPVLAHAWLNTPDSIYAPTPRTHPFDDGIIRVVAFGDAESDMLPALNRVHQRFAHDGTGNVQVVFVTESQGHVGSALVTPAEEVAWLKTLYATRWRATMPIALWAGEKVAHPFGWHQPIPSPVPATYPLGPPQGVCIIVDGHGIVRAFQALHSRAEEAALIELVTTLRAAQP